MQSSEVLTAWLTLDQLFTNEKHRDKLADILSDESAAKLLDEIAPDDDSGGERLVGILAHVLAAALSSLPEGSRIDTVLQSVEQLIGRDPLVVASFTPDECLRLVTGTLRQTNYNLNMLDQITGLYLALSAYENTNGNFFVTDVIDDGFLVGAYG